MNNLLKEIRGLRIKLGELSQDANKSNKESQIAMRLRYSFGWLCGAETILINKENDKRLKKDLTKIK